MALSALQKLLRNPRSAAPTSILASLPNPISRPPNPTIPSGFPNRGPDPEAKPNENGITNCSPFLGSLEAEKLTHFYPSPFFPIPPIGFGPYSILTTGSVQDGLEDGDSGMWADSVKKKRKKKMNKHKYQKLRKRLRRRT